MTDEEYIALAEAQHRRNLELLAGSGPSTGSTVLRGKRVQIEGVGNGAIVDETESTVGVLLDGKGCRVMYVRKQDLEESPGLWS